nr:hypothetical protein [Tanacetum cinerariifolium]
MQPVATLSPNYVPGPEHLPSLNYVLGPEHPPSLVKVHTGGPEEDHANYPADRGDGDDEPSDDDDDDDEHEEPFEDEDDDEKEEHLASADSSV